MEKVIKNHKSALISTAIAIGIQLVANLGVFINIDSILLLFAVALLVGCLGCFYCLSVLKKDVQLCGKLSMIVGPLVFILCLIDGFCGFTINMRFFGWISLINGPGLLIRGIKLSKYIN